MTDGFSAFAAQVAANFQNIAKQDRVFVSDVTGDELYETYLASFPEGTNPVFKKRTEHDCSCCKGFIRRVGNVVSVKDGVISTIWDDAAQNAPTPYNVVASVMRSKVLSRAEKNISGIFRVSKKETSLGSKTTRSLDKGTQRVLSWEHFYTGEIPASLRVESPGQVCGEYATTVQVFERGLIELSPEALQTVKELIDGKNLYRGDEFLSGVTAFQTHQRVYRSKTPFERKLYVWEQARPGTNFRNSVIGTLVQDLSGGRDLESAVASFEAKVAPQNYKRTTALITPRMVENAMKTIKELDLETALERRLAVVGDVSVRDVLWVNDRTKPQMKDGLGAVLLSHAQKNAQQGEVKGEDISIDDFVTNVLPTATEMEVLVKNEHLGNLMVLTAPAHPEVKQLFRWDNDFAWSYGGNVTDSIKERVKKAGGRVEGALLRVSLSWTNHDDLDLHIHEPPPKGRGGRDGGHISFANKRGWTGGELDVDMNAGGRMSREPVENVVWHSKVPDGAYRVVVNNFNLRETADPGFMVEIECGNKLTHFSYNKGVKQSQSITVCTIHMKDGVISKIELGDAGITSAAIKQTKWGLTTGQFVPVNMVCLSPNYWGDNQTGNKHTFFVLDGCECDEEMRGIYNEFLHPRLNEHRKVFEVIGDKTKCRPTPGHIAGLGLSSTKRDSVTIKVRSAKGQRMYNVKVG